MDDKIYTRLAERLDQIPNGFARAASGSHLRLLAKLFTPDEARLATAMRLTPEPSEEIAQRAHMDPKGAYRLLKGMARKGLVQAGRGQRGLAFALIPFAIGIYELQIGRMDAEMAALFEAWFLWVFVGLG